MLLYSGCVLVQNENSSGFGQKKISLVLEQNKWYQEPLWLHITCNCFGKEHHQEEGKPKKEEREKKRRKKSLLIVALFSIMSEGFRNVL